MTAADRGLTALLIADGLFTVLLEVLFLPLHVGTVLVPFTAVVAAVMNVALVSAMTELTDRPGLIVAPLVAWALGLLVCLNEGPGGDVLLSRDMQNELVLFVGAGLVPAVGLLVYRRARRLAGG